MGNTLLTPALIAQEALMQLENNLVLGNLVNKDYSNDFTGSSGDTITVRKPNTFKVKEFDEGTGIELQNVKESGVPVKLDTLLDISFPVTTKEMTLSISDFSQQFIVPAMQAFAQDIDSRLAKLMLEIPYHVGIAGSAPSAVASITALRKKMNDNKVPMAGRNLVLDTAADAKLLELDAFNRVDASGTDAAIRNAELGMKFGLKVADTIETGATTIAVTDSAIEGVIKKGTLLTVAGSSQQFVVTADATIASHSASVNVYPAVDAGIAQNSAITLVGNHTLNMAFHRNAFSLVSRQLARPMGLTNVSNVSYNGDRQLSSFLFITEVCMKTITLYDENEEPIIVNACDVDRYLANGFTEATAKTKTSSRKSAANGDKT